MNRALVTIFVLLLGMLATASAQESNKIRLKGCILDARTGEAVAFANLGLLGTVAGVASDMDGRFEWVIPERYATRVIRVSAVGYAPAEMKVYEAQEKGKLEIRLRPVTYGIGAVDVYGQLLVYRKMLRNVITHMGRNYISKPYNYEGYFKHSTVSGEDEWNKEATVTIYDSEGYTREDVAAAYRHLNYEYNEVRRSREALSVADGLCAMDDILTADIVRHGRNVLDISNSRDYKLKNKGIVMLEGDSVQIIGYTLQNPSISTSGDASVTGYEGEIYVNRKDWAVVRNIVRITSSDFNGLGRNLIHVGSGTGKKVTTTLTASYRKLKGIYFLSGASMEYAYAEGGKKYSGKLDFVTTRVRTENPEVIEGRRYYENLDTDKDFWDRYSVYFEE